MFDRAAICFALKFANTVYVSCKCHRTIVAIYAYFHENVSMTSQDKSVKWKSQRTTTRSSPSRLGFLDSVTVTESDSRHDSLIVSGVTET